LSSPLRCGPLAGDRSIFRWRARKDFVFTTSLRLALSEAKDFALPFPALMMSPLRKLRGHIPVPAMTPFIS